MEEQDKPLSLVLFSGTDDKLTAAAVLAVGAAAMGRQVNLFLQYYALDAFRAGKVCADHGLDPEATARQASSVRAHKGQHWSVLLKQAKEVGEVDIHKREDLVDGLEEPAGATTALAEAQGAITLFI